MQKFIDQVSKTNCNVYSALTGDVAFQDSSPTFILSSSSVFC